jgi:hypothetical protein
MPFDKDDPRSVLVAPSSDDATAATEFSPAQFIPFTDDVADHSGRGTKTWVVRVRNAAVAHSSGVASDRLDGMGDDSDRLFALTDDDTVVRLTHDGETFTVSGRSVVVVPPGPVSVEFVTAGNLLRVFSSSATDVLDRSINADAYRNPTPNVAVHVPWPSIERRLSAHRLADHAGIGKRFGNIFRSTNLMLNLLDDSIGPRDATKLSPHFHTDFEQLSIQTIGEFCHHVRTPWTPDIHTWSDDCHHTMQGPGAAVLPPPLVHTSQATGLGVNRLLDVFSPPREDFLARPGWVLNKDGYPDAPGA